jgi:hypothetical protein
MTLRFVNYDSLLGSRSLKTCLGRKFAKGVRFVLLIKAVVEYRLGAEREGKVNKREPINPIHSYQRVLGAGTGHRDKPQLYTKT